ncbi:MAG: hypothetical protein IT245_07005 [Bacteroidia bacterium]|nr:hypothetical protein [Bacteroidia bacterium]
MLVEVKKTTDYGDILKEAILNQPGPFLVVVSSEDKGIDSNPVDVRILAKSCDDRYHIVGLHTENSKRKGENSWAFDLPAVLANYKLLPKGFQITLTQTV